MADDLPDPGREGRPDDVTTVEWGPVEPPRRGRPARILPDLRRDPRISLVVTALGALATFAAMVGDWIITTLPNSGPDGGPASLPSGVSDLGNLGGGYLFGTLALLGCLALVLFGSVGVRHNARMVGLAICAGTGGIVVAITLTMENATRTLFAGPGESIEFSQGRGLAMAYVGTAAFAAALLLAAPFARPVATGGPRPEEVALPTAQVGSGAVAGPAGPAGTPNPAPADPAAHVVPPWPWQRSRDGRPESDGGGLPPPPDLTVAPAPPFAQPGARFTRPEQPPRPT